MRLGPDRVAARATHLLRPTATPYVILASLFDALLGDRFFRQARGAFEWLVSRYGMHFASAADVACGTGTFVRYLRERGVPVVYGIDRSPEMLRVATAKNQGNSARFLLQDFARLQLPGPVDLITCHFDSLNYMLTTDELLYTFRRFHANMKSAGHFIFDLITEQPPRLSPGPCVQRVTGPGFAVVRVTRRDPRTNIQTAFVSISRNGCSHREIHVQRGYPIAVVVGLLAQARFALLGIHDFQTLGQATNQDATCDLRGTEANSRRCYWAWIILAMRPSVSILIFDLDALFREGLRNFLLAAGYQGVGVAATEPEALAKLTCGNYQYVLIGLSPLLSGGRELALEPRRLQSNAKIFPLISAENQPFIHNHALEYIIKESVFSNLLQLMAEAGGEV